MVRFSLLLAPLILFSALAPPAVDATVSGACSAADRQLGRCSSSDRLELSSSRHLGRPTASNREATSGSSSDERSRPDPIQDGAYLPGCPDIQFDASNCVYNAPDAPPPQDTPGPAPTVTLEDLASFSPRADRLSAEPGDWAIAGLAVNPVADDAPASASGELLGLPAEVRFTPVEFLWDHGDGSTLSTSDGGATWAELGQAEFSDTATSHVYGEPGIYTLALTVRFAAEYAVGGGPWTPVAGTLLAESGSFEITVGSAGTVLVDRDCRTGARGPGC